MSKNRPVKIMSFLMALLTVTALLPMSSPAKAASDTRTLFFNSIDATLHYDSITGDVVDQTTHGAWSGSGNTLTLNGFKYSTTADRALVMSGTLILEGENELVCTSTSNTSALIAALYSADSLEIKGNGKLNVTVYDPDADTYAENGIYIREDLTVSGDVEITIRAEGSNGGRAVSIGQNFNMSGDAQITATGIGTNASGPNSFGISAGNLYMQGGTIYAKAESPNGGYGVTVHNFVEMSGGEIYAMSKFSGYGPLSPFLVRNTLPSGYGYTVTGSSTNTSFNDYTIEGTFTKLTASGIASTEYRPVATDEFGRPRLDSSANLNNVKVSAASVPAVCNLHVFYFDENNKQLKVETIAVTRNTTVTGSKLTPPEGYILKNSFSLKVTDNTNVAVTVVKAVNQTLNINYVDENGELVGTQKIVVLSGTTVTGSHLNIPAGYKLKNSFSKKVTQDETIAVSVVNAQDSFNQTVYYRDEKNVMVGAQELTVKKGDVITNVNLKAPAGYKIKSNVSITVTLPDTPITVTVIPFADEDQYKNTEYIEGYPEGLFKPDLPITRAEVAAIFNNLFAAEGFSPKYSLLTRFTDLKSSHWAYGKIAFAVEWRMMQGYPENRFRPDGNITRAELVTVLYNTNLMELDDTLAPVGYGDIASHWAKDIIDIMSANGMLEIFSGNFEPNKDITRAETVMLIHTYLKRDESWLGNKSFPDIPPGHWAYTAIMNAVNGT